MDLGGFDGGVLSVSLHDGREDVDFRYKNFKKVFVS